MTGAEQPPRLYSTAQAAAELGVSRQRVTQIAAEHDLGQLVTPRARVFTADDVAAMRGRQTTPGPVSRQEG